MAVQLGELTLQDLAIYEVDIDPSLAPGFAATLYSQAMANDGSGWFIKSGAAATAWTQTSNPFKLLQFTALAPLSTTTALSASTLTLTATSTADQYFTGTTSGFTVKLPDATTLPVNTKYTFYNQGTKTVAVVDGSGAALFTLAQSSIAYISLQTNGTVAGGWISWQIYINVASGIVNYNLIASAAFSTASTSDIQITGFSIVPVAGTYQALFSADAITTGSGVDNVCTIYLGAAAVTDSMRTNVSPAGSHKFNMTTQTVAQWDGIKAATVYVHTAGSLTVNGRSLILTRLGN